MLAHLDLPPDPNCARFHEAESRVRTVSRTQVRQPVHARGLGRWKAYAAGLAPLIAELDRGGALEAWRDNPQAATELAPPLAAAIIQSPGTASPAILASNVLGETR